MGFQPPDYKRSQLYVCAAYFETLTSLAPQQRGYKPRFPEEGSKGACLAGSGFCQYSDFETAFINNRTPQPGYSGFPPIPPHP